MLCTCRDCWSVNGTRVVQYHDQHHHQFNFNYSRKAINTPPTGTLKVDKPCIIFSVIQWTNLKHKKNTNTGTSHTTACSHSHWNTIYKPKHGKTEQFCGNAIVSLRPLIRQCTWPEKNITLFKTPNYKLHLSSSVQYLAVLLLAQRVYISVNSWLSNAEWRREMLICHETFDLVLMYFVLENSYLQQYVLPNWTMINFRASCDRLR